MALYKLYIDGAEHFVRATEADLRQAMFEHLREWKKARGTFAGAEFCWVQIRPKDLSGFMQSRKNLDTALA